MKKVIIQASARSEGNTNKIIHELIKHIDCDVIDLNQKNVGFYQYINQTTDDFLPLIKHVAEDYDVIILATPVYWYSMSAQLKAFLDRLTECLKTEKEIGRKLRGKHLAAISCGSDDSETPGFFVPFSMSAEYLGMNYLGHLHSWIDGDSIGEDVAQSIRNFSKLLN